MLDDLLEAATLPEGVMYVNGVQATAEYYGKLRSQVNIKAV